MPSQIFKLVNGESNSDVWLMQELWLHEDVDVEAKESIES